MASHRILLTGANGFIASHVLSQLLSVPTNSVRAVVRSQSKVDDVKSLFPAPASRLDFAIVPDMTAPGAFDQALQSTPPFDVVMHMASPFLYKAASSADDFLVPAIKGTTEVLSGIQRVAKDSVKRVVLTSSFAAVGAFGLADETNRVYTEEDWNPVSLEFVRANPTQKGPAYLASKKFAEKAAWEISKKADTKWELVVLNPPMVYGPLFHKVPSVNSLNESVNRIWSNFLAPGLTELPPNGLHLYVDVRDIARAHVLAVDAKDAGGKRFITTAGAITSQQIADILRSKVDGAKERVPEGEPGKDTLAPDAFKADTSRVETVLGLKWTDSESTFADLGKQLLEIEKGSQ
jgi:nucleoside-diphosphate-sugar epimerase